MLYILLKQHRIRLFTVTTLIVVTVILFYWQNKHLYLTYWPFCGSLWALYGMMELIMVDYTFLDRCAPLMTPLSPFTALFPCQCFNHVQVLSAGVHESNRKLSSHCCGGMVLKHGSYAARCTAMSLSPSRTDAEFIQVSLLQRPVWARAWLRLQRCGVGGSLNASLDLKNFPEGWAP